MNIKKHILFIKAVAFVIIGSCNAESGNAQSYEADIVIYDATASGVMAAVAAGREGNDVHLFEPGENIGGMVTGGLSHTDYGNRAVIGGLALEFYQRVGEYYDTHAYFWRGPEPHVGEKILMEMLNEANVEVHFNKRLDEVVIENKQIKKLRFLDGSEVTGKVFIDAGYEGDLMARSGVSYSIGRESIGKYNESYAGRQPVTFTSHQIDARINPFVRDSVIFGAEGNGAIIPIGYDDSEPNELLPLINPRKLVPIGEGDGGVQAYCFRMIATDEPDNMVPWSKPENYNPSDFELLRRYYQANPNGPSPLGFRSNLPNNKGDINSGPGISTNLLDGSSWEYPDADYTQRDSLWQWHEDYTLGLAYFAANDPSVPERVRDYMNSFGLAKDEYTNHDHHLPHQLYIREARRMEGEYIMTQHDMMQDTLKYDSIGMGSYNIDVREVQRNYIEVSRFPNLRYETYNEGYLSIPVAPYEIPYRSIVPKYSEIRNLIVPVTLSGSHVVIASVRMEPQYMLLGHSAGVAASMAVNTQRSIQKIDIEELQYKLVNQGQVLSLQENIYGALNPSNEEIIIDNSMSDFVRMSGIWWNAASNLHPERYEMNYLVSPKDASGIFQFRPYFFKTGNYDTYIWYPSSNDYDNNVEIKIYTNQGVETETINQQSNGGGWVHIGRFSFQEGQFPAVEIIANDNEFITAVDAIKFQYVD